MRPRPEFSMQLWIESSTFELCHMFMGTHHWQWVHSRVRKEASVHQNFPLTIFPLWSQLLTRPKLQSLFSMFVYISGPRSVRWVPLRRCRLLLGKTRAEVKGGGSLFPQAIKWDLNVVTSFVYIKRPQDALTSSWNMIWVAGWTDTGHSS